MAQLPTQSQFGDYSDWPGRDVLDSGGQRLGGVREIYLDRETGRPEWVLVDVTDSEARFVPLANADIESWSIRVAHDAEQIRSAPGIGAEPRIDESEERRLYKHYGLGYSEIERSLHAPGDDAGHRDETPSWQARGGERSEAPDRTFEQPAAFSPPSTETEPTNLAPPPAEPPSPAELESAHIPEEPPAASDRATGYETAPFGAVAPSTSDEPGTFASTGDDAPPAGTFATTEETPAATPGTDDPAAPFLTDTPGTPTGDAAPADPPVSDALTPHAAPPESPPLAPPVDAPSTLTPPSISLGAEAPAAPPVTADRPVADATPKEQPSWASSPPPDEPAHGALDRVKRSPGKIAVAGVAAAVLFFIVRKLR